MTSAPPAPSIVSAPRPPVMMLAAELPMILTPSAAVHRVIAGTGRDRVDSRRAGHGQRRRQRAAVEIFEVRDTDAIARRLVGTGNDGKIDRGDGRAAGKNQYIGSGPTVDR